MRVYPIEPTTPSTTQVAASSQRSRTRARMSDTVSVCVALKPNEVAGANVVGQLRVSPEAVAESGPGEVSMRASTQ